MEYEDFRDRVLPVLVERWLERCFCDNPGFLKLISFGFADYGNIAPVALRDSELVWNEIVGERFRPLGDWSRTDGGSERIFQCPQCRSELRTLSEEYSINMATATTRPTDDRRLAGVGLYLLGFHYFTGKFDPKWIADFKQAPSAEAFIESITSPRWEF